jgi:beta-galactosidase
MRRWRIGAVWVNGHNLGRFWAIGPQQTLYCPGCWLKRGTNQIIVMDLEAEGRQTIEGLADPILDEVPGS